MRSFFIIIILFIFNMGLKSQINPHGIPLMRQYTDKDYGDAGQIWAIEQDNRGLMYFGSNYGLIQYNGKDWRLFNIENSTVVRSLAVSDEGIVFYGAMGDFGMLTYTHKGTLIDKTPVSLYHKLSKKEHNFTNVWKTYVIGEKVYFQSFEKLFEIDFSEGINSDTKIKTYKPEANAFHLSFSVNGSLYINDRGIGLKKLKDGKLSLIKNGDFFADKKIYLMLPFGKNEILIGTHSGFFTYNPQRSELIKPFIIDTGDLILKSYLYNGTSLPENKFALGTFMSGTFIINKAGKTVQRIYKGTGTAENSALAIYYNKESKRKNLWISTQNSGLYKVNYGSGFYKWNEHNGINGAVTDIENFKGKLYAAASTGLYGLTQNPENGEANFEALYSQSPVWDLCTFYSEKDSILVAATQKGIFRIEANSAPVQLTANYTKTLYQLPHKKSKLIMGFNAGYGIAEYLPESKSFELEFIEDSLITEEIVSAGFDTENEKLWLGASSKGYYIIDNTRKPTKENIINADSAMNIPMEGQFFGVLPEDNRLLLYHGSGISYYDYKKNKAEAYPEYEKLFPANNLGLYRIEKTQDAYWLGAFSRNRDESNWEGVIKLSKKENAYEKDSLFAQLIPQKVPYVLHEENNRLWISNTKGLYTCLLDNAVADTSSFNVVINKVTSDDSVLFHGDFYQIRDSLRIVSDKQAESMIPVLDYKNNEIKFSFSAPVFTDEERTKYSYRLIGDNNVWSGWKTANSVRFTNLSEGSYEFQLKAINIYEAESKIATYKFEILPPWYRTTWAILLFVFAGILFLILILKLYTRRLRKEKERLERIVDERTKEIQMKNAALQQSKEEIEAQRDEIEVQRDRVMKQRDKIADQQKSIMDSIKYASRIQTALLPPDEFLEKHLPSYFVLFRPRDVVSGDFYWATQRDNCVWIVASDCTGHGVPGAFMSMLGMSFLNEIVNQNNITQAHLILNHMRENVKRSLRQTGKENEAKDGMDMALCKIDYNKMTVEYAGAYNPLYQLRDGKIIRHKADRMPIGIYIKEKDSFTKHTVDLKKGDRLYIFSDGYVDQFGGEKNMKLGSKRFKKLLLESSDISMPEQKEFLNKTIEEWMDYPDRSGNVQEQVDDIIIIGIEI